MLVAFEVESKNQFENPKEADLSLQLNTLWSPMEPFISFLRGSMLTAAAERMMTLQTIAWTLIQRAIRPCSGLCYDRLIGVERINPFVHFYTSSLAFKCHLWALDFQMCWSKFRASRCSATTISYIWVRDRSLYGTEAITHHHVSTSSLFSGSSPRIFMC